MRSSVLALTAAGAFVVGTSVAHAGVSQPNFGQLSYNGTPIAMTSGTGVGNDGYYLNWSSVSTSQLLVGIKAHEYYNGNNPAGSSTTSQLQGGGSWLNIDANGAYSALAGVAVNKPAWNPNAPRWGFTWSVTLDGARASAGLATMSMIITRPDNVAVTLFTGVDVGGEIAPGTLAWQNNWNLGYLGVFGNGVDANTVGDWKIRINVAAGGATVGSQEITVNVVPAPGALALVGLAGVARRRRR